MKLKRTILIILLQLFTMFAYGETLVVKSPPPEGPDDARSHYYLDLLELALEQTIESDGPYKIERAAIAMPQSRAIHSIQQDQYINVMWTMTTQEREQLLLPVRIPLLKGLLGHRIFIIRAEDQAQFSAISNIRDLAKLEAGQGLDWPDTQILRSNNLPVITGNKYPYLFRMLRQQRFDYFPRGVHEPWTEVITNRDQDLAIEQSILLQYPAPSFFFVNKDNVKLQQRLEKGLRMALEDGSFDQLLYNSPDIAEVFTRANMEQRKLFRLQNPLLSEATRALLDEPMYWYQPGDEKRALQ